MTNTKPGLSLNFEQHVLTEEKNAISEERLMCYEIPVSEFIPSATVFGDMKESSRGRSKALELFQFFWALIQAYRKDYKIELKKFIRQKKREMTKDPFSAGDIRAEIESKPKEAVRVFLEVIPGKEDKGEIEARRLLFNGKNNEENASEKEKFHNFGMEEGEPVTVYRFWVFQTETTILPWSKMLNILLERNSKECEKRYRAARKDPRNTKSEPHISSYEQYYHVTDIYKWADLAAYYTKEVDQYEELKLKEDCELRDDDNINNILHPNCVFSLENVFWDSLNEVGQRPIPEKFGRIRNYIKSFASNGVKEITFPEPSLVIHLENSILTPKTMSLLNLPNFQVTYKDFILKEVYTEVEKKIHQENKRRINRLSSEERELVESLMRHSTDSNIMRDAFSEDEYEEEEEPSGMVTINTRNDLDIWRAINSAYGCGTMKKYRIEKATTEHELNSSQEETIVDEYENCNTTDGDDTVPVIHDYSESIDVFQSSSYLSMLDEALINRRYPRMLESIKNILRKRKEEFIGDGDMVSWRKVRLYALQMLNESFITVGSSKCKVDQKMIELYADGELLNNVHLDMPYHDEGYSVFGHNMIWQIQELESDEKVYNLHIETMKLIAACKDSPRREFNLHINFLIGGDKNAGKSHMGTILKKILPEGVVEVIGYSSTKAGYDDSGDSRNFIVEFINEGPINEMESGKTFEVHMKDYLAEQKKVARVLEIDKHTGKRHTVLHVSECIGVKIICSNQGLFKVSRPLRSRFVNEEIIIKKRPDKTLPGLKEAENNPGSRETKIKHFYKYMQRTFLLHWMVELFIYEGLLVKPSLRVINHVLGIMTDNGNFIIDPRLAHFIKYTVRSYVITNAILLVFDVPGAEYYKKKFELKQLFDLEPYLCDNLDIVIFVLGLYEKQITQNKELRMEVIRILQRMAKQEQEKHVGGTSYRRKFVRNTIPYSKTNVTGNRIFPASGEMTDRNYIVIPGSIYQIAQEIVDDMENRNKGKVPLATVQKILFKMTEEFVDVETEPMEVIGIPLPDGGLSEEEEGEDLISETEKKKERHRILERGGGKEKCCYLLSQIVDKEDNELEKILGLKPTIELIKREIPDQFTNEEHKMLYGTSVSSDMPYILNHIKFKKRPGKRTIITDCGFITETAKLILDGDTNSSEEITKETGIMEDINCSIDDYFTRKHLKSIGISDNEMEDDRMWSHRLGRMLVKKYFDIHPEKRTGFSYPKDCIREANIIHLILLLKNETSNKKNYFSKENGEIVFYIEKADIMNHPQYEDIMRKWRKVRIRKDNIVDERKERGIEILKTSIDKFRKSPINVENPPSLEAYKSRYSDDEGDSMDRLIGIESDDAMEEDEFSDDDFPTTHILCSPIAANHPPSPVLNLPTTDILKKRKRSDRETEVNENESEPNIKRNKSHDNDNGDSSGNEEESEIEDEGFTDDEGISYWLEVLSDEEKSD